jgi:oligopeptide transport system substrate-binding protein
MKLSPLTFRILALVVIMAQIMALAGCSAATPAPTQTPLPSPTDTPMPTATPSLVPSLTPTRASTNTPTPSQTPRPSATPPGFLSHTDAGFSVIYPTNWSIVSQETNSLAIKDPGGMVLYVFATSSNAPEKFEDVLSGFEKGSTTLTFTLQKKGDTKVGGTSAPYADLLGKSSSGQQTWRVIYYFANRRSYVISFITSPGELDTRQATIDRILSSFQFFSPVIIDLPVNRTLVMLGGEPDAADLDPAVTQTSMEDYVGLLYSTLVRLTPEMQIVPELAEKWSTSADGSVYTFTLRANLKFASGAPITARVVADSWERACNPATSSATARTYLGDILGANDRLDKKATSISGLKVIDDRTLQVTLDAPKPYFLAKLTYPTAAVANPKAVVAKLADWVFKPDASGPYMIKEHRANKLLTFERNPNYFSPPAIAYVAFILDEVGTGISLYEDNTIDMIGVGANDWKRINDPTDPLNKDLHTTTSLCTSMLRLNSNLAPFDDPLVRQAFSLATDQASFIDQVSQGTTQLPAVGILPPSMPGFLADRQAPAFSAADAKALLMKSKYAGGLPAITLAAAGYASSNPRSINVLIDMWQKNLGIKVNVQFIDPQDYSQTVRKSGANLLMESWCADYPDPENFLDVLFHSKSEFNIGRTNKPDLDALLEKARVEQDGKKRLELYQQAETLLLSSYEVIPLNYSVFGMLVKPRVKSFVLSPINTAFISLLTFENK